MSLFVNSSKKDDVIGLVLWSIISVDLLYLQMHIYDPIWINGLDVESCLYLKQMFGGIDIIAFIFHADFYLINSWCPGDNW